MCFGNLAKEMYLEGPHFSDCGNPLDRCRIVSVKEYIVGL